MKIIDYKVIVAHTGHYLERYVRGAIQDGWEPQGGVAWGGDGVLFQAVVKYERGEVKS